MRDFCRVKLVVSRCLGFAACRYNGQGITDPLVDKLKKYADIITPCPEVEIGLGIPRPSVRMVFTKGELRLYQPDTKTDVTDKMKAYMDGFFKKIDDGEVDGFILKSRSPSCGIKDVKVYPLSENKVAASMPKTGGFFGGTALERYPNLAVEDEGRLTDLKLKEHFLTKIFTLSEFRKVKKAQSVKKLIKFQDENKLLFMGYNQQHMRLAGKIAANMEKKSVAQILEAYEKELALILLKPPKYNSNINVLHHAFGYFSDRLNAKEKKYFLDMIEVYREGTLPISVPLSILKSYIARFGEEYLERQTFFEPYPVDLLDKADLLRQERLQK